MCAAQVIEKLLSRQARGKSEIVQVAVRALQVRTVRLHSQRHEAVLVDGPALAVRFGQQLLLLQARALELFPGAGGAGDDGDGALSGVRLAFLSPAGPGSESLSGTRVLLLAVLSGGGDLAGVRHVLDVFALVVAVLVAVAEICQGSKGDQLPAFRHHGDK